MLPQPMRIIWPKLTTGTENSILRIYTWTCYKLFKLIQMFLHLFKLFPNTCPRYFSYNVLMVKLQNPWQPWVNLNTNNNLVTSYIPWHAAPSIGLSNITNISLNCYLPINWNEQINLIKSKLLITLCKLTSH